VKYRAVSGLRLGRKLLLAVASVAALGGPLLTGVLSVRSSRAQSQSGGGSAQSFEVASIKPNRSGARNSGFKRFTGGELDATNITVKMLIAFAYDTPQERILQGPAWLDSERYDILAKPDQGTDQPVDRSMGATKLRTQTLLADRFKLTLHKETRQLPVFRLLLDKGGPKHLLPPKGASPDLFTNGRHVTCQAASMEFFAKNFLTGQVGGPVFDDTGVKGNFDFSMDWSPSDSPPGRPGEPGDERSAPDPMGPSLFTALREQLGLKLEAGKGPVEVLVIAHAEKLSEN
jgi:bla regulator protein blaR1